MDSPLRFTVDLEQAHDSDVRKYVRLYAFGENDLRNQVREFYPGWRLRSFERPDPTRFHDECGYAWHAHDNRVRTNRHPFGCPTETMARSADGDR